MRLAKPAGILAIAALTAGTALADSGHHDRRDGSAPRMGFDSMPMGGDRHEMMEDMMRMMMQMHGSGAMTPGMTPGMGPMTPGMGPMGRPGMYDMSMMDRDMMRMMMGPEMMRGMPMDRPGQMMQSRLEEYDANDDGSLSLDEFAAWHAAIMRETMVDRFQHLDADGDGAITSEEMNALTGRVNRMRDDDMNERPMMRGRDDMDERPMMQGRDEMDERPMRRGMPDQD